MHWHRMLRGCSIDVLYLQQGGWLQQFTINSFLNTHFDTDFRQIVW